MNEEEHELRDEVDQSSFQLMSGTSILSNFYEGKALWVANLDMVG